MIQQLDMQEVRAVMYAAGASLDTVIHMSNVRNRELWEALQAVEEVPAYT